MSDKVMLSTFETASGAVVHRIPVEAFPNFWAFVYLVLKDEYCALIDAGSGTDSSHEHLLAGFQQAGIQPSDLTHILLTHAHIDHMGGLARLRPLTNARIGCHVLDLQTVAHHEAMTALVGRRLASFLAETGLPEEVREQILGFYRVSKAISGSVPVDFLLQPAPGAPDAADLRFGPFVWIHLPGHSPGHIALRLDDVVFCGDVVVQGVTPHLSPQSLLPHTGLDHYLQSLARFQQWAIDARLVFNGHDDPITDLPSQIHSTRRNILRRMRRALEALQEPLTMAGVCDAVYGEMAGYNQLLVIEKAGAYVEYLYEHGVIEITNPDEIEGGEVPRYRLIADAATAFTDLEKRIYAERLHA